MPPYNTPAIVNRLTQASLQRSYQPTIGQLHAALFLVAHYYHQHRPEPHERLLIEPFIYVNRTEIRHPVLLEHYGPDISARVKHAIRINHHAPTVPPEHDHVLDAAIHEFVQILPTSSEAALHARVKKAIPQLRGTWLIPRR